MSENMKQNYLNHPKGIMSWLLTLDHKRIGLMYLAVSYTHLRAHETG